MPKEWNRAITVRGIGGTAIVDYSGNIRAIPPEKRQDYWIKKEKISGKDQHLQHTKLLDEIAPKGTGIKSYVYDPDPYISNLKSLMPSG
jgi:hypothetical protein